MIRPTFGVRAAGSQRSSPPAWRPESRIRRRRSCRGSRAARIASGKMRRKRTFIDSRQSATIFSTHCTRTGEAAVKRALNGKFGGSWQAAAGRASSRFPAARTASALLRALHRSASRSRSRTSTTGFAARNPMRTRPSCANCARTLGVPCPSEGRSTWRSSRRARTSNRPARRVRYEFFAEVAAEVGAAWIATGHTADDQAETVLHRHHSRNGIAGAAGDRCAETEPPEPTRQARRQETGARTPPSPFGDGAPGG